MIGFGLGDASVFLYDVNKPVNFAVTITVFCIISIVGLYFFKEKPAVPPSLSQV